MSMTQIQAKKLGALVVRARRRKGLSLRALAALSGIRKTTWLAELEAGKYLDPAPERLAALADLLDIPPSRIDELTHGAMTAGLPKGQAYFRAKYNLTAEQSAEVERYIEQIRRAA